MGFFDSFNKKKEVPAFSDNLVSSDNIQNPVISSLKTTESPPIKEENSLSPVPLPPPAIPQKATLSDPGKKESQGQPLPPIPPPNLQTISQPTITLGNTDASIPLPPIPPLKEATTKDASTEKKESLAPLPPPPVAPGVPIKTADAAKENNLGIPPSLPPIPTFKKTVGTQSEIPVKVLQPTNKPGIDIGAEGSLKLSNIKSTGQSVVYKHGHKSMGKKYPETLPILPPLGRNQEKAADKNHELIYNEILEKFPNIAINEEIPFFPEDDADISQPVLEELPVLNVPFPDEEPERDSGELLNFKHTSLKKPLFIRTDYYSEVLSTIDTIKNYVVDSSETIYSLENLKRNAEIEHNNYRVVLEDIQRKLIYVDKILFEKEG